MTFTHGQKIDWEDVPGAVEYRTKAVAQGGGTTAGALGEFTGTPSEVAFAQLCGAIADNTVVDIYVWARNAGGVESDTPASLLSVTVDQSPGNVGTLTIV